MRQELLAYQSSGEGPLVIEAMMGLFDGAADQVRATDYPQAQEFADHNILQPPTEDEMLRRFGGAPG